MMDATYRISRTSRYGKLKFYSMNPLNPAFVAPAGMYVHHYGNSAADYAAGSVKENNKNTKAENNNVIVQACCCKMNLQRKLPHRKDY
jgi:hypothetical protein